MTNLEQIKQAVPEALTSENVMIMAGQLDKLQELQSVINTPPGQELVKALREDCSRMIQAIIGGVKDPLVYKLEAHLNLLTTLISNEKEVEQMQEALDDEIKAIIS